MSRTTTTLITIARTAALAALALVLSPRAAEAAKRGAEVVIVEGPGASAVEGWIEDSLGAPDTLQQEQIFRGALGARGALPLRLAAGDSGRTARLVACAHAAAGEAAVDGALLVDIQKTSHSTRIHVWRIDMRPGGGAVEGDVTLPRFARVVEESRAVLAIAPPPAPTPVTELAAAPVAPAAVFTTAAIEPAPALAPLARPPGPPAPARPDLRPTSQAPDRVAAREPAHDDSLLSVRAAFGVGMRHFSYVDRVTPTLRSYDLGAAPMASLTAVVYPLDFTSTAVLRDFGITGDFAQAFAFSSEDASGNHVGATWRSFGLGATERFALTDALLAHVSIGYGKNDFQFDQALVSSAASLPSVAYQFVRAGADLTFTVPMLAALSFTAGGGYLDLISTGYTNQLFPRQTAGGIDARLGASYQFAKGWAASLDGSYMRVFYAFNPVPGDANVAGGALDQQTRILAGLSYAM